VVVLTARVTVVEWDRLPLVLMIVRVYVPVGVVAAVETVRVELPEPASDVGLKLAVAPVGKPFTPRLTVPVKPFRALIDAVKVALFPGATVCALGAAVTPKSGPGTTSVTIVECDRLPSVPVTVRV